MKSDDETRWFASVRADAPRQRGVNTATLLPRERLAVATRLSRAPNGPDDPVWADVPSVGRFFRERLDDGPDPDTAAAIAFDAAALYVRFASAGGPARPSASSSGAYYRSDSVELFLDPAHGHFHYFQFAITAGGVCVGARKSRPLDSQRWESKIKSEDLPAAAWAGAAAISAKGWSAQFTIPFALLGVAPSGSGDSPVAPMGINLLRQRCDGEWPCSMWNETHGGPHAPWGFGQLYFEAAPSIRVERVDLGEIKLWENRGELHVNNLTGAAAGVSVHVAVRCGENGDELFHNAVTPADIPAPDPTPNPSPLTGRGTGAVRIPFVFPFNPEDYRFHHLHLELRCGAQSVWKAVYRFGRGQVGWLLQIDDRREGPDAKNPAPGDPEFMAKKRRYIIRRLPRFLRKTTAQGAPSDFTLEAADGSVRFDLMRPGALTEMARYIYSRYDNDIDRLLGANFFIHQTAVMTYANAPSGLVDGLNPLSVIRFGSGECCCFASALAGLAGKMNCEETGRTYRAARVGVPGHVTTVVEFRGKRVHLDPSVGRFYFLRDNLSLASMEELLADPALAARAGKYLEDFHRKAAQSPDTPYFQRPGAGVWPPGAPEE